MNPTAHAGPPGALSRRERWEVRLGESRWTLYGLPLWALAGLVAGLVLTYLLQQGAVARWVWYAVLIVGGTPLMVQTLLRVSRGQFASDVIATLAIVGAIALDEAFAGVVIVLMQSSGQALDAYAFHRASSSLDALLARAPRFAHRSEDGTVRDLPVELVRVGDRLVVRNGDLIPVDGTVASAIALIDESSLTGEPVPARRALGDLLLSGTANVGPPFEMVATRPSGESQYAQIVKLVRTAQERKPRIQRLADRYAVWFTPLAVVVAALGWALTSTPDTALAVLVVATPCPLIIATPIAVIGAVNRAADRGLVVKTGGAIEEMGRVQAVLFDKTGTITAGRPEVENVVTESTSMDARELLRFSAALEMLSNHPLATAVVRAARAQGVLVPTATEVEEVAGAGLAGNIEGHLVVVGSSSYVGARVGADPESTLPGLRARPDARGRMVSFVAIDGAVAGAILFSDRLRPGVPQMVQRLEQLGVRRVGIVTGDGQANALEIAQLAGIKTVRSGLSPQQKVDEVRRWREQYRSVAMVGDGVNDAAALAASSVGVAMGAHGAGISSEAADVVLLVDDVSCVPDGIRLGQRMDRIAKEGILFGLGASGVLMVIAASGFILPAVGAVLQEVIDIAVIVNALRVR